MKIQTAEEFASLRPTEFGIFHSLTIKRTPLVDGSAGLHLSLVLGQSMEAERCLEFVFEDVRDLKVGDLNPVYQWLMEIRDVGDRGLEGIQFRVVESEHDSISLWCRGLEAWLR